MHTHCACAVHALCIPHGSPISSGPRAEDPMANERQRILITSALPYINGIKHLGNLVGSQLPADVYARYMRARGHEVLLICATDEHGTPAELAAAAAGEPVADYCARLWKIQSDLADRFNLSFDHFGRSSSPQNHRLTQHFAGRLYDAGLISEVMETPGLLPRRRPLPARPLHRGHLPQLRLSRAPAVTSARTAPSSSTPPTSSTPAPPSPAPPTSKCARPNISISAKALCAISSGNGSTPAPTGRCSPPRSPANGSTTATACRTAA